MAWSACAISRCALPSAALPSGIGIFPLKYSFWKSITSKAVLDASMDVGAGAPAMVRMVGWLMVCPLQCGMTAAACDMRAGSTLAALEASVSRRNGLGDSGPMDNN
ncbi:hypothetical protein D3C87_1565670 [compost metagenome]